jgi:hypothetical protein
MNDEVQPSLGPPGDAEQMLLIDDADIDDCVLEWSVQKAGEYDGSRLVVRDPAKYAQVAMMLSEGMSVRYIKQKLRVAHGTIMAIREREAAAISTLKEQMAKGMRRVVQLSVEEIEHALQEHQRPLEESPTTDQVAVWQSRQIKPKDMAVIVGILTEKSELLSGGPTSRVAGTDEGPGHSELAAYMKGLRDHARAMDCSADKTAPKDITDQVDVAGQPGDQPLEMLESSSTQPPDAEDPDV